MKMTDLSPEAQKIWKAFTSASGGHDYNSKKSLAAALKSLVEVSGCEYDVGGIDYVVDTEDIYRIAAELETNS